MATRLTERSPLVPVPAPDDPPPAAYRPRLTTARLIALAATGALAACATIARAGHPVTSAPRGALASARRLPDAPATPTEETFRIFDDAPERRASVAVGADGHTSPSRGSPSASAPRTMIRPPPASPSSARSSATACTAACARCRGSSRTSTSIPTAVFGARAGAESDTKFAAGADRWLAPAFEAARGMNDDGTALNPPPVPIEDALEAIVGFKAQAGDFAAVAEAAGYDRFIAVGESQSTAAALWAAVEYAETISPREAKRASTEASEERATTTSTPTLGGKGSPRPVVKGSPGPVLAALVLTLVPTMHEQRAEMFEKTRREASATYGSLENATLALRDAEDCSLGYGCVPFAKYVGVKRSDLPSMERLAAIEKAGIPTLVLANYEDEPAHPVENARVVARATGGELHVVRTHEQRAAEWPKLVAAFIEKHARKSRPGGETPVEPHRAGSLGRRSGNADDYEPTDYRAAEEERAAERASTARSDAYDAASSALTLTRSELQRSSRLCEGNPNATPRLVERCLSYLPSEGGEEEAFSPFYARTGLDVEECEESGLAVRAPGEVERVLEVNRLTPEAKRFVREWGQRGAR